MIEEDPINVSDYKYKCVYCNDIIFSSYSGEFVKCKCGKSFVDITEAYGRFGGKVERVSCEF